MNWQHRSIVQSGEALKRSEFATEVDDGREAVLRLHPTAPYYQLDLGEVHILLTPSFMDAKGQAEAFLREFGYVATPDPSAAPTLSMDEAPKVDGAGSGSNQDPNQPPPDG